jgi:hypothetical protein
MFTSIAKNLVPGDANDTGDIFVRDRRKRRTRRLSVGLSGAESDAASSFVAISRNGRGVAFHSGAMNLVSVDVNARTNVFTRAHIH